MVTRFEIDLPDASQLAPVVDGELRELRFALEGLLEQPNETFDRFRMRFQMPVPAAGATGRVALIADRSYRPGQRFLVRLRLIEEVTGKVLFFTRAVEISDYVTDEAAPLSSGDLLVAVGQDLGKEKIAGSDSLTLIPPVADVVFGLWRAEALVSGSRIQKVRFLLDGIEQMARRNPPYSAELRLSNLPREQTVRAEGYDDKGELVASDEVVINQPHGELRMKIVEPARGTRSQGEVAVKLEVVVPEEKKVARVVLLINDVEVKVLEHPPWETTVHFEGRGARLPDRCGRARRRLARRRRAFPERARRGREHRGRPGRALHHGDRQERPPDRQPRRRRLQNLRRRPAAEDRQIRAGREPAAADRRGDRHLGLDDPVARRSAAGGGRFPRRRWSARATAASRCRSPTVPSC